jgi:two-component system, LytTR family, response regulator LytT
LNVDKKELQELWTKLKDIRKKSTEEMSLVVKKTDGSLIKIKHTDLTHISAAGNYVEYHTATGNHLSRATMKEVEEMLKDFSSFIRIHRSHFVNIQYVQGLYQNKLRLDKFELPIGNKYFKQIESIFEKTY